MLLQVWKSNLVFALNICWNDRYDFVHFAADYDLSKDYCIHCQVPFICSIWHLYNQNDKIINSIMKLLLWMTLWYVQFRWLNDSRCCVNVLNAFSKWIWFIWNSVFHFAVNANTVPPPMSIWWSSEFIIHILWHFRGWPKQFIEWLDYFKPFLGIFNRMNTN